MQSMLHHVQRSTEERTECGSWRIPTGIVTSDGFPTFLDTGFDEDAEPTNADRHGEGRQTANLTVNRAQREVACCPETDNRQRHVIAGGLFAFIQQLCEPSDWWSVGEGYPHVFK